MICIFPGTFNPIHEAHIRMAEFALEKYGFEKIVFIPSYLPPHKDVSSDLAQHRLNMVRLATHYNPKFEVSDIEYKSEKTSYSLLTVKKIIEQYSLDSRLNFIIGTDAFAKIETWFRADELKSLIKFIVFPRRGDSMEDFDKLKTDGWIFEIMDMDYVDISSTEIRNGEKENLVDKVEDYIKDHELYKY